MSLSLSQDAKVAGLLATLSRLFAASQSRLSTLVALGLVAATAWIAGQLVWLVLDDSAPVERWRPSAVVAGGVGAGEKESTDVSRLVKSNLFGKYSKQKAVSKPAPVVKDAPKTKLNLVLVGVVASSRVGGGLAVISNRGSQATYGIDEQIEGTRATLKAVLPDRVIIDNSGRDETLMLEGIEYSRLEENRRQSDNRSANRSKGAAPTVDELARIRREINEDPQKFLQYIRLTQVKRDGAILGYKLRPGKSRKLFDSVGLADGDIALELNGMSLSDPASMGKIWQSMNNLSELNLVVDRDGQLHDIYIEF